MAGSLAAAAKAERSAFLSARQATVDCEGIDPLLLMSLVLDAWDLRSGTYFGAALLDCVEGVLGGGPFSGGGDEPTMTTSRFAELVRQDMSASWPLCKVRKVRQSKMLGGQVHVHVVRGAKKAQVLQEILRGCEAAGAAGNLFVCMLQIKYATGARVHEAYTHPSEFLVACRDRIMSPHRTEMVLMEVPNRLQLLHCFYVDWDMHVSHCTFLPCDGADAVDFLRTEAMKTPEILCRMLIDAGFLDEDDTVQVVVVEGTRGDKVSIHFVFKALATRDTYTAAWNAVLEQARTIAPRFDEVIAKREARVVDSDSVRDLGPILLPLVGMDLHPHSAVEQGFALPFSYKKQGEAMSRPIAILHIRGGVEMMWEVPCREVWRAGTAIGGAHPDVRSTSKSVVLGALLDASVCIPGPRCIALRIPPALQPNSTAPVCRLGFSAWSSDPGSRDSSRCSTDSSFAAHALMPSKAHGEAAQRRPALVQPASVVGGTASSFLPGWFSAALAKGCPGGVVPEFRIVTRYGSRPTFARKAGGVVLQANGFPVSMCIRAAMEIPFVGFHAHSSNNTIFYVDGEDVYASCMRKGCIDTLVANREKWALMARRLERLIIEGDNAACSAEGLSQGYLAAAGGVLLKRDVDFLVSVCGDCTGGGRKRQADLGCSLHVHPPSMGTVARGCPNNGGRRKRAKKWRGGRWVRRICIHSLGRDAGCSCVPGDTVLLHDYVGAMARDRCIALDGHRTWLKLSPDLVGAHLARVARPV